MPQFSDKRRVRHAAADMFDLVADVERYPEFVPLCRDAQGAAARAEAEGVEILVADMTVAYKLIRESFTSRVTLDRPNLQILVEYLRRPVQPSGEPLDLSVRSAKSGCEVEFFIAYEFKSRMLGLLMGADVRRRVPALCARLRAARRSDLCQDAQR